MDVDRIKLLTERMGMNLRSIHTYLDDNDITGASSCVSEIEDDAIELQEILHEQTAQ